VSRVIHADIAPGHGAPQFIHDQHGRSERQTQQQLRQRLAGGAEERMQDVNFSRRGSRPLTTWFSCRATEY